MTEKKIISKKAVITAVAIVLVLAMVADVVISALIKVNITGQQVVDSASAAKNYLADNTDYVKMNDADRARTVLKQAIARFGNEFESHYEASSIAIAKEDYETALQETKTCLAMIDHDNIRYGELLNRKGCLEALLDRKDEAEATFRQVTELTDDYPVAHLMLAELSLEKGDAPAATEELVKYAELSPGDVSQLPVIAELYYGQTKYTEAISWGEKALETGCEPDMDLYNTIGLSRILLGDLEAAEKDIDRAVKLGEEKTAKDGVMPQYVIISLPETYYYRGLCALAREDYDAALPDFEKTIEMGNTTALSFYNRGICRLQKEDYAGCLEDMTIVAESDDESGLKETAASIVEALQSAL